MRAQDWYVVKTPMLLFSRSIVSNSFATPSTITHQGSLVHGILQARILAWIAFSFSRALPDPRIEPVSPALLENTQLRENSPPFTESEDGPEILLVVKPATASFARPSSCSQVAQGFLWLYPDNDRRGLVISTHFTHHKPNIPG